MTIGDVRIMVDGACLGSERVPEALADAGPRTECLVKNPMGYLEWMSRAETLHRKGVRQKRCPACGKVYWPFERDQHVFVEVTP